MADLGCTVVVGGTAGVGLAVATAVAAQGDEVVICGRSRTRAEQTAQRIGPRVRGLAVDLAEPARIAAALSGICQVRNLVLTAIERDRNTIAAYDIEAATRLTTLKLVGYTEVVHALAPKIVSDGAVVMVGGLAMARPYPGSTTVSTVNGAISALVRTLAVELAPIRANAIHPSLIGDSPYWTPNADLLEAVRARVPTHRLVTTDDVVHAVLFLLANRSMNGTNLLIDGGELLG